MLLKKMQTTWPAQHKRPEDLVKHGGADGLAAVLQTSLRTGLAQNGTDARGLERRRAKYGANRFKEVRPRPFLRLLLHNLNNPMLILLMVAAAVRPAGLHLGACSPCRASQGQRACSAGWQQVFANQLSLDGTEVASAPACWCRYNRLALSPFLASASVWLCTCTQSI